MAMILALVLSLVAQNPRGQDALPRIPRVARGQCPFECCRLGEWTAKKPIPAFSSERTSGTPAFVLPKGARFYADSANLHTLAHGQIRFVRTIPLDSILDYPRLPDDSNLPDGARLLLTQVAQVGDTAVLVGYLAEAGPLVWFKGHAVVSTDFWATPEDTALGFFRDRPARLLSPLREEWWVRIRYRGRTGWIDAYRYQPDGTDSCG